MSSKPITTSHGLFGQFSSRITPEGSHTLPDFGKSGIVTNATPVMVETSRGGVLSTHSVAEFGRGGMAAIAGKPRWLAKDLTDEASKNGDAAALSMAYTQHGKELLKHVGGTFSFAVIDPDSNKVLAGIDRLGQHTLYYCQEKDRLIFGSTATATMAQMDEPAKLTEQGLYDYVYFHMVPSPQSVYQGLSKLPAAHCLEFCDGQLTVSRYWAPQFKRKSSRPFAELTGELRGQLSSAVARSIDGVGTAGTFLSGGLDSSTVTGMLAEITDASCPAYAIGFDEEGYDEMEFARNSARHFGVNLREYYVTPQDVVDELPTIATSYDEPFGNSSALPAYFCGKRAQEDGIDCLLAGDGGDEIFAGNGRYAKQQVFDRYSQVPQIIRNALLEPAVSLLPSGISLASKAKSYIEQAKIPLPDRLQTYNYLNRIPPSEIFNKAFLETIDTQAPLNLQRETYHSLADASTLSRMLYLDWQYTLADNDLRKVSRMCAIAGVGVRYPMLDEELVAFSCEVQDDWKIKDGNLRHFFKQSLTGWLPEATINKKKQGFGLPFGLWMQSYKPLQEMANDSILRLKTRGYFQNEFLDRLLALHRDEHAAYYGELIWILTVFDLWLEGRKELPA